LGEKLFVLGDGAWAPLELAGDLAWC
jgi:hypothetical protein